MDKNRDSADSHPTEEFGPVGGQAGQAGFGSPGSGGPGFGGPNSGGPGSAGPGFGGPGSGRPGFGRPGSGGRPGRRPHVIRWVAGGAAVAVLAGGAVALAATGGSAGGTAALTATSGGSAGSAPAGQAGALAAVLSSAGSPTSADQAAASPASATTSPAAPGPTTGSQLCATGAGDLRAAGHPRLARRAAAVCRGRLGRLRLLIRGEHGEVTYRAKDGTSKTLAFERGKVTAVSGSDVTVAAADGTTWTWHLVGDSVVRQGGRKVSPSSLAAGQQVFAGGPVLNGTDDARLIVIAG
jgi:hypothetical protein